MTIIVVGSGPSGTNAALTLLKKGKDVAIWDVGLEEKAFPDKNMNFNQLKAGLEDPQTYFLGNNFDALMSPISSELMEYPPLTKLYNFS